MSLNQKIPTGKYKMINALLSNRYDESHGNTEKTPGLKKSRSFN